MTTPLAADRRTGTRGPLYQARRRFPRLHVACDVFFESDTAALIATEGDFSLRGVFVPTRFPDVEGARGTVRVDSGDGPLIRFEVEVLRAPEIGRKGMAMRICQMSDRDRLRYAAFLLRKGGLPVIPQLDRKFRTVTRSPRPLPDLALQAA